jgi:CubicO group peptidase (beta-lactamase class C family)
LPLAAQDGGLSRDKVEALEKAISSEMSRQNIPGLSVAVVTDNQFRWANGYGLADLENFVPAKATTVYRLGSISKPITAVATMQLVERGKIDLDAPVQKYVPGFPQKPWPITVRQLLGHMSGIRHYKGDEMAITRHYTNLVDGLEIFKNDPLLYEPGTKFFYSTYGYNLLGCAIEGATGIRYVDYVRENIFRPAGMDHIRADDVNEIIPNRAQGYSKTESGGLRNSGLADTSYKIPGGGFCSTVVDLARFAIALQNGILVKKYTLEQMWTRQKTRGGQQVDYGLGWAIDDQNGVKRVAHGGGQQRVTTFLAMIPEKRVAIILMTNLEGASGLAPFAYRLAEIALR